MRKHAGKRAAAVNGLNFPDQDGDGLESPDGWEGWDGRVFIGLGANLPLLPHLPPRAALGAAAVMLEQAGVRIARRSRWYETLPEPYDPAQPHYVNGVMEIETRLLARPLMSLLLHVEAALGRVRAAPNAPRTADLDLLAYGPAVHEPEFPGDVALPHPRMAERAFVMGPLAEIAPRWRHPQTGLSALNAALGLDISGMAEMADGGGLFGTEWCAPPDLRGNGPPEDPMGGWTGRFSAAPGAPGAFGAPAPGWGLAASP